MNLASILAVLQALPQLLGVVNIVVHDTEQVLSAVPGSQKLAAATAKVNTVLGAVTQDANTLAQAQAIVPTLINGTVAAFNAASIFQHKAPAPAAAQAQ